MKVIHKSVLLNECIEGLKVERGGIFVDGTLGFGGHSEAILRKMPQGKLIGIDRDRYALASAGERLAGFGDAFQGVHGNFFSTPEILDELGIDGIDGCLMDLGVSSYQLDTPERGFSYNYDTYLDMRMDTDDVLTAFKVVNEYSEWELLRIIKDYGEENWASRIASFIVKAREDKPIETTGELVEIIKAAIPARARRTGPHPARRTFQAIRIEVNGELAGLGQAIERIVERLNPGGRLCIISFHSLEDRIVKRTFRKLENPCTCPPKAPMCVCGAKSTVKLITHKPILPSEAELAENTRAESAKLRILEKI